jgi:hypothetical protein
MALELRRNFIRQIRGRGIFDALLVVLKRMIQNEINDSFDNRPTASTVTGRQET